MTDLVSNPNANSSANYQSEFIMNLFQLLHINRAIPKYIKIAFIIFNLSMSNMAFAQLLGKGDVSLCADSVRNAFDLEPYFGLYKNNYFIFGPPIGMKATNHNTNVKFQVSIRQKLTKSTLPGGTYLYLYYTQKVFWNILEESFPMKDLNFNPGIGLAKPIFKNGKYIGKFIFQIEHESNGRDSIESRSWNRISLGCDLLITNNFLAHAKFWFPFVDGENNSDLLKYVGIGQLGVEIMSNDRRWSGSLVIVKRKTWRLNFNTIAEVSWKFSSKADWCLFAQYYNGYGEGLLDYNNFSSHLRAGIVIRPKFFSDY